MTKLAGAGTEICAKPRSPALELVQRLREAAVSGLGQLLRIAGAFGDLDVLDPLADEQLLELRLLLDVLLSVPDLYAVQRRDGDVDVPALDQVLHLTVEEREDQRADVRAVDVGVGHDDDSVVAQLL